MYHLRSVISAAFLIIVVAAALYGQTPTADSTIQLQIAPRSIEIGVLYRGVDVEVTAEIPEYDQAVLLLKEDGDEVTLNRKGREAGIWLNVAQVTIKNAPKVYILAVSESLDAICPPDVQQQLGLGISAVQSRMDITSEKSLVGSEADEFVKLKMKNGTYRTDIGIELQSDNSGQQRLSAKLPIPATVPPGLYNVSLYCFRDGDLVRRGNADLSIKRVGLAEFMASLAHNRAALYGVMAILIAMVVGVGMGIIFHSLPGSGH